MTVPSWRLCIQKVRGARWTCVCMYTYVQESVGRRAVGICTHLVIVIRLKLAMLDAGDAWLEVLMQVCRPVRGSKEGGRPGHKAALQGSSHLRQGRLWCLGLLERQRAEPA